jgi:hypothetical protein
VSRETAFVSYELLKKFEPYADVLALSSVWVADIDKKSDNKVLEIQEFNFLVTLKDVGYYCVVRHPRKNSHV